MKSARLPMFLTLTALGVALVFGAFARRGSAAEGLWQTDFKAAQAKAKAEKKYLLVDFTGSDWCPWCIRLHNEVFDKAPFTAEAPKQFVLVELDFPHKEQSDELKKQNKELSEKYDVKGFPTVLLLEPDGQVMARTGYREGGPEPYLKQLAELPKTYQNVVALKAKLDKSHGIDRAKMLDEIIEGYEKLGNESEEVTGWSKEIIALDADNKAGLKVKYEIAEVGPLLQAGQVASAKELLDKALALKGVSGEVRQEGLMLKAQIALMDRKFADAVAVLKMAKEAASESPMVKQIDAAIQKFGKVAEVQEAAKQLEAKLENVAGLDRAKLLDKLIETTQKLLQFDPDAHGNIKTWTKEVITLDADNKAGLKKKYQFKAALADAQELLQAQKTDEANAALDKALETAGPSGEDVQVAQFLKAQISLMEHNNAQGIKHLQLALDAAPAGQLVPYIKGLLARYEAPAKKPVVRKAAAE